MIVRSNDFVSRILRLGACLLLLAAAAAGRSGRLLGRDLKSIPTRNSDTENALTTAEDGAIVITSSMNGPGVSGYGGPVPVTVTIRDGVVAGVRPVLPNDDTPLFFSSLTKEAVL